MGIPAHAVRSIETLLNVAGDRLPAHDRARLRGLIAPNVDHTDRIAALGRRDDLLRQAGAMLPKDWSDSAKARLIARRIAAYHESAWIRGERIALVCPSRHLGTMLDLIWHALRADDTVIGWESIRKILVMGNRQSQRKGA